MCRCSTLRNINVEYYSGRLSFPEIDPTLRRSRGPATLPPRTPHFRKWAQVGLGPTRHHRRHRGPHPPAFTSADPQQAILPIRNQPNMDDNGAATQPTQMAATQIASQPDAADDANVWGCLLPCNSLNTYVFRINLQNAKYEYTVGRSTANDIPFVKAMTVSEFPSL